jgi:hypothetical protein
VSCDILKHLNIFVKNCRVILDETASSDGRTVNDQVKLPSREEGVDRWTVREVQILARDGRRAKISDEVPAYEAIRTQNTRVHLI